jgi:hypothetical protein
LTAELPCVIVDLVDAKGLVAIYAALVATGALGWNVFAWLAERREARRREQTRLDVLTPGQVLAESAIGLLGRVVNRSDHDVHVESIALWSGWNDEQDRGVLGWYAGISPGVAIDQRLPAMVTAKDGYRFEINIDRTEIEKVDPALRMYLVVSTADARNFRSDAFDLDLRQL